jgi:Xaa-Pro aminopeptidase
MIEVMGYADRVVPFHDAIGKAWSDLLVEIVSGHGRGPIGFEADHDPAVFRVLAREFGPDSMADVGALVDELRIVKDAHEIENLRICGRIVDAMMAACREALHAGVPEYEVSLAAIRAGTIAAAAHLTDTGPRRLETPMIRGLQVLKTGATTVLGHCRPTVRRIPAGEPVAVCLCGMVDFRNMKAALDRPYFIGSMTREQERVCSVALESQQSALRMVRPGALASDVHLAACEVLKSAGYKVSSRTGRGLGHSNFEKPQLLGDDRTVLRPGMVLVVDGNVKVPGCGVQFGDMVLVTEHGHELLTGASHDILISG